MKKVVVFLFFFTMLFVANSQKTTLSGTVFDKSTGKTLPGANVVISGTLNGTFSASDGSFSVSTRTSFPLTVIVSYMGYNTDSISLQSVPESSLKISLTPAAVISDEIVIKAIRINNQDAAACSNLDPVGIAKINTGTDIPVMLDALPSVTTSSDAGAGIGYTAFRMRGTDQSRINVTINGVPYNDPESHNVYWVDIPDIASSSESIQVQRGVGTSTNGSSSFGGSINISTHSYKPDPLATLNFKAGSFGTYGSTALFGTGLLNGQWTIDGRASIMHSDGYIDRASADIQSLQTNVAWYGEKTLVRMMLMHGKEKTYQAWEGVPKDSLETNRTFNPYWYENEIDLYTQNHFHLVISNQHSQKWTSSATAFLITGNGYYEQYKDEESFSDYLLPDLIIGGDTITETNLIRRKMMDNYFYGAVFSANYDNRKKLQINLGGNLSRYDGDHIGNVIWMQYSGDSDINHEYYLNNGLKDDISGYAKLRYSIKKHTTIIADMQIRNVRYQVEGDEDDKKNLSIDKSFLFANPKASILHAFGKHSVYGYFGVAGREPNRYMMVDADSGKMPVHEILFDYEAGYKYTADKWNINLNLFYMNYRNQLVQTGEINNIGSAIYVNVPESYRAGIEGIWEWKINKKFDFSGNATYSVNKIKDLLVFIDDWDTWSQHSEFYKTSD
ncbi:MAG TPA: TonB-dependent receptor, partial [Bacteroidales bacterium]|nr:TonB-dependent receptor [Bacteroidales bacterium]